MKKTAELRDLSVDELQGRVRDLTEQLFKLRFQKATGQLENSGKIRQVRRSLARVNTLLSEKQKQARG